jgi:hypothetical protein
VRIKDGRIDRSLETFRETLPPSREKLEDDPRTVTQFSAQSNAPKVTHGQRGSCCGRRKPKRLALASGTAPEALGATAGHFVRRACDARKFTCVPV